MDGSLLATGGTLIQPMLADTAVRLSATPRSIRHRAPMLGEHTGEILGELGYSPEDIAALRSAEAV